MSKARMAVRDLRHATTTRPRMQFDWTTSAARRAAGSPHTGRITAIAATGTSADVTELTSNRNITAAMLLRPDDRRPGRRLHAVQPLSDSTGST